MDDMPRLHLATRELDEIHGQLIERNRSLQDGFLDRFQGVLDRLAGASFSSYDEARTVVEKINFVRQSLEVRLTTSISKRKELSGIPVTFRCIMPNKARKPSYQARCSTEKGQELAYVGPTIPGLKAVIAGSANKLKVGLSVSNPSTLPFGMESLPNHTTKSSPARSWIDRLQQVEARARRTFYKRVHKLEAIRGSLAGVGLTG